MIIVIIYSAVCCQIYSCDSIHVKPQACVPALMIGIGRPSDLVFASQVLAGCFKSCVRLKTSHVRFGGRGAILQGFFLAWFLEIGFLFVLRNPRGGAADTGKSRLLSEHHRRRGSHRDGDRQRGNLLCSPDSWLRSHSSSGQWALGAWGNLEIPHTEMLWSSCFWIWEFPQ